MGSFRVFLGDCGAPDCKWWEREGGQWNWVWDYFKTIYIYIKRYILTSFLCPLCFESTGIIVRFCFSLFHEIGSFFKKIFSLQVILPCGMPV